MIVGNFAGPSSGSTIDGNGVTTETSESIMQIGVHLPHIGRTATPEAVTRAAVQAEELGLADVGVSEHVILPKDAPYPPSPA